MKIITLLNEKGGVGKTTLATHLGAGLAAKGLMGIIVDTDGQGDSSKAVGLSESSNCYDFIMRADVPTQSLVTRVPEDFSEHPLFIVQGNDEIRAIPMVRKTGEIQKALLKRFAEFASNLDFVVFDTQPSPTSLHSAIATISDSVIIPFQCEGFSVADMKSAFDNMNEINELSQRAGLDKARVIGLVPNMYNHKTVLHKEALAGVREQYGDLVWRPIPMSIAISTHQYMAETVMKANEDHFSAKELQRFIDRAYNTIFEVTA